MRRTQRFQQKTRRSRTVPVLSFVSLVLCSVSLSLMSSACARPESAGTHVRIAVGGQNQMVYLPTTLAQQLGFYREEGIDAELQDFAGGAKGLQAAGGRGRGRGVR